MKKLRLLSLIGLAALLVVSLTATSALAGDPEHNYAGIKKCKMCHKSEKTGAQYTKWAEGPHAKAWETLGTDAAKAIAKEKGIADPQQAPECLKCHVTGYGVSEEILGAKWAAEDGVTCEQCHGFGKDYLKKAIMKDQAKSIENGLKIPTEATCTACHNEESPTFESFDFAEYKAKIAHPTP